MMETRTPTREEISALEAAGLVTVRAHNALPLRIVNYTPRAQFERAWTPALLQCRGLVYDVEWNLVARPLPKFFNYEEHLGEDPLAGPLPSGPFTVTEKYDGSLGIVFRWKEHLLVATRGSFHSEQAERDGRIIERWPAIARNAVGAGYTHLFEIIYPENRIVVDYGNKEELRYLTTFHTETREELEQWGSAVFAGDASIVTETDDPSQLKRQQRANAEGYVLRYANGQRVKIKFDQYVELHRLVTGLDSVSIWECLRNGQDPLAVLTALPDELYGWARQVAHDLKQAFHSQQDHWAVQCEDIIHTANHGSATVQRKEFAALALKQPVPAAMFLILDQSWARYDALTWATIKPQRTKPVTAEEC